MNGLIYHFISGQSLFSGLLLLTLAALVVIIKPKWFITSLILTILAAILIWLSSTPMNFWVEVLWCILGLAFLITGARQSRVKSGRKLTIATTIIFIIYSITLAGLELSWHFCPAAPTGNFKQVFIIGDSVSAGVNNDREPWPDILGRQQNLKIKNLAIAGAVAETAMKQAKEVPPGPALILLEIGGNDMLGGTPPDKFAKDLDTLLGKLQAQEKQLVMMELPLDFMHRSFGLIQRRLALKYSVYLIPKRYFAKIITTPGATIDTIHLSPAGHQNMATMIGEIITPMTQTAD